MVLHKILLSLISHTFRDVTTSYSSEGWGGSRVSGVTRFHFFFLSYKANANS